MKPIFCAEHTHTPMWVSGKNPGFFYCPAPKAGTENGKCDQLKPIPKGFNTTEYTKFLLERKAKKVGLASDVIVEKVQHIQQRPSVPDVNTLTTVQGELIQIADRLMELSNTITKLSEQTYSAAGKVA